MTWLKIRNNNLKYFKKDCKQCRTKKGAIRRNNGKLWRILWSNECVPSLPQNTAYKIITKLNANISIFQEKIIPKNLSKKGGCKFVIAPPFRRKGGAPVRLHLPPPGYGPVLSRVYAKRRTKWIFFQGRVGV